LEDIDEDEGMILKRIFKKLDGSVWIGSGSGEGKLSGVDELCIKPWGFVK
jgi:hypothetical protein